MGKMSFSYFTFLDNKKRLANKGESIIIPRFGIQGTS